MNEMYWITRVGNLNTLCEILIFITGMLLIAAVVFLPMINEFLEDHEEMRPRFVRLIRGVVIVCAIAIVGKVFIPTQKEMLLIYGVGGAIDYVQSSDKAKELPDKAVEALSKYLEETKEDK